MINLYKEYDFFSSLNKKDFISFSSNYELIERKIKKIYIFCSLCSDIDFNSIKYCKNYGYVIIDSALSSSFYSLNGNNIEVQFSCNDSSKIVILNVNILDNSVTIEN